MAVDWFADPLTWTGFLRAHGVQLRTGDDLRLMLLLDQLPTQGIALPDATAVARWVGPVLCNNADQQADLEGLLTSFAALVEPLPQASVSVGTPEVERALNPHEPWWWWVSIVVLVGLAILPIATFWTSSLGLMSLESSAGLDKAIFPRGTSFSVAGALSFLSVVCILLLGIVLVAARRWRRAFLLRGVAPRDARQSGFGIPVVDLPLFRREALRPIFADLRRHRMVPGYGIDVPASIAATVAAAGFATLAPMQRRAQPDHLLLVDLAGRDDHMSVLAELLMARARAEDVAIERFDFRGDARYLQAVNGHDAGQFAFTDLQTLYARCPDHRLLILSDSAVLVDSASESLRDWVDDLLLWQEAAVITPLPAAMWGPRERALIRRGFALTEATPPGIASLVRQLREDMPTERATPGGAGMSALDQRLSVDPYLWLGDTPPTESVRCGLLADLEAALGREGFFWLSALAVFPVIHPKLTLALGGVLADADGERLMTEGRLSRLCRLPWLRRGRMPDWLRLTLVRELVKRGAEAERARAAWAYLLDPVRKGGDQKVSIKVVKSVCAYPSSYQHDWQDEVRDRSGRH